VVSRNSSSVIDLQALSGFHPSVCLQGTLLVLDEPTNHLDIPSKEMLEEAIRAFEGAVIAVSHDRYFLKQIATRVLLVGVDRPLS
jgi:ATPase subunit of ABC transporter with duplicated ATPase domains